MRSSAGPRTTSPAAGAQKKKHGWLASARTRKIARVLNFSRASKLTAQQAVGRRGPLCLTAASGLGYRRLRIGLRRESERIFRFFAKRCLAGIWASRSAMHWVCIAFSACKGTFLPLKAQFSAAAERCCSVGICGVVRQECFCSLQRNDFAFSFQDLLWFQNLGTIF